VLSALVLAPTAFACIWLGAETWTLLIAIGIAVLTWEWVHLCGLRTRALPGMAVPVAVLSAGILAVAEHLNAALVALLVGWALTWWTAVGMRGRARLAYSAGWLAAGVLYIGIAGIALIELRHDNQAGRANVLFLFFVVAFSDIGAYMAGRAFGGPKLAPAISPNKTWSGAVGGLLAAMVVGVAVAAALAPGGASRAAAVAAMLAVMAQAGDLLESWIKRRFDVKDTSSLIPGHGGLLDRLDGVIAAAPVAALLAWTLGQGQPLWR
jgi:phosphatidate cytidylyltransferase